MSIQHPPETFIRTYNARSYADPVDSVTDYQRVLEYASLHPNKGSSGVAAHFDFPRGRVRSWMGGSKPGAVRGVDVAESHGWLSLDDDSPLLVPMTKLVELVFSGGPINAHWVSSFIVDDADQERDMCYN